MMWIVKVGLFLYLCKFSVQDIQRTNSNSFKLDTKEFFLIWIDDNLGKCSEDCRLTKSLLQQHVPTTEFEWDVSDAIYRINVVKQTNKFIFIVVSGQKASSLFRYLSYYNLDDHIDAIFLFCNHVEKYHHLKHNKLIGIFNDRQVLGESIRATTFILINKKDKVTLNIFDQEQTWSHELPLSISRHMWYELLLEVILDLPRDEQAKLEMLEKSREYYVGESEELRQIEHFRQSYTVDQTIEWYTADSFVHKLVNKALRSENIDLLYAFRFFIGHLKLAIEREHLIQRESLTTIASKMKRGLNINIQLYSGQNLPQREVNKLKSSIGKTISVNGFFSTSLSLTEASDFAKRGVQLFGMQRVLIEIILNTSTINITSFVEIQHRSRYQDEEEVLFDCKTLFKIISVKYDEHAEIWRIRMKVVSKNSIEKQPYLEMLRETVVRNHSAVVAFGIILAKGFDRKEQACNYFDHILSTYPTDHKDIPDVLQQRAILYEENGDSTIALRNYQKALQIRHQRVQEEFLGIASITSSIAILQSKQANYTGSLAGHHETLNIYDMVYGSTDHISKGNVNENIALVYQQNGNVDMANEYFTRAWTIYSGILSEEHPSLIQLLGYLGAVHEAMNNSNLAIDYYRRQLNWTEKIFPVDHPLFITCLSSLVRVHEKFNSTFNSEELIDEHLENRKKKLGDYHPAILHLLLLSASLFEYTRTDKAIELYKRILRSNDASTLTNHEIFYTSHKRLAALYRNNQSMVNALTHALRALSYRQQHSLAKQDYSLEADELYNVGSIALEMNKTTDALQYLTKSLSIYQSINSSDHPNVQIILTSIIEAANRHGSDKESEKDEGFTIRQNIT